ncbi:hypothetical protein ACWCPW_50350, partial [Embleya sp. NPDC001921]
PHPDDHKTFSSNLQHPSPHHHPHTNQPPPRLTEPVNDEVERITGSPARSFREWAVDHAADFH